MDFLVDHNEEVQERVFFSVAALLNLEVDLLAAERAVVIGNGNVAIDVARAARRRALENFGFSALYNLVAAPMAVFGMINPFLAALAMSGSSLVVTLNALRMNLEARR